MTRYSASRDIMYTAPPGPDGTGEDTVDTDAATVDPAGTEDADAPVEAAAADDD